MSEPTNNKGLKNESETAMVNEPSVFEPLKFCCTNKRQKDAVDVKRKKKKIINL